MTTLLLTNRFNPTKLFYFRLVLLFIIFSGFAYLIGKTDCNPPKQDIPDVAYKARAFLPITSDTTKPKQKVIYNHYKLEGSDTLFQQLWLQVQSPADVTPRNLQKLRDWLQSSIKIDSTIKQ